MIVGNFDLISIASGPFETNPPLIVDPNAMLSLPISLELLKSVSRRVTQILQCVGGVKDQELPHGRSPKLVREPPRPLPSEKQLGVRVAKGLDHK